MSVKWCKKNLNKHSQAVYEAFTDAHPDIACDVSECVDFCGLCTDVPFALRNASVIAARDPRGLFEKLERGMSFTQKPALPGTFAYRTNENDTDA